MRRIVFRAIAALGLVWSTALAARADVVYSVTLDTSALLANNPADAPFLVDFQLNDNSGDVNNNTATISDFMLGGGSLDDTMIGTSGQVTGNLDSSAPLIIGDAGTLDDFNQVFTPGAQISFMLDLTTNNVTTAEMTTPDEFSFTVFSDINSFAPDTSAILSIDITGYPPTVSTDTGGTVSGQSQPFAPVLQSPSGAVPEPSTLSLMAFGLVGLAVGRRRQRQAGHKGGAGPVVQVR